MKFKCNKTLVHGDGSESFTKGQIYESYHGYSTNLTDNTMLKNNQGLPHCLGTWFTKFTIIH